MKLQLDGHTAYAYTGGRPLDASLPGVVFVHGALHDHSVWIQQSRYLAHHGHTVLAVDLPGHGRSGGALLGVEAAGSRGTCDGARRSVRFCCCWHLWWCCGVGNWRPICQ